MRVLLLTDDMFLRGVPRHVGDLAGGLGDRGHTVILAASEGPYTKRLTGKAQFIPLPIVSSRTGRKDVLGLPRTLGTLVRTIRDFQIDVIHSHKR